MLLTDPHIWLSLLTLTILEIVLGVDNLVFISIVSNDVTPGYQKLARRLGLLGALFMRLLMLAGVFWLTKLTTPLFRVWQHDFSIRNLILLGGGLFLLVKATSEIHGTIEADDETGSRKRRKSMWSAILQIMMFDVVFSLDSILTAVGLTNHYWVMAVAICIAIATMLFASEPLHQFIHDHPTVKILALSFLLLIGAVLIADGFDFHVPREYIYFSISFAILVEALNGLMRKRRIKSTK